jgi:mannose-6-phosphate isomerase-like protein (cupin superfamily)
MGNRPGAEEDTMRAEIKRERDAAAFATPERCHITEVANDDGDEHLSVALARVEPGVTTAWHKLDDIAERYLIVGGRGRVQVGDIPPADVVAGDVVRIPPGVRQRIENIGREDLLFYAVCTPPFQPDCYIALE